MGILNADDVLDSALAAEEERHLVAGNVNVPIAQRRETVRLVLFGVLVIAHANQRCFEQPHDRCEDFLLWQFRQGKVFRDPHPYPGKQVSKIQHALELRTVANLAPARVVSVLFAITVISADGLEVSLRRWTDPDIFPCGRDREGAYAFQGFGIADDTIVRVDVAECFSGAYSTYARHAV